MKKCDICFTIKTESVSEYDVIKLADNLWPSPFHEDVDPGWYSGDDGEICGPCMLELTRKSNGIT